MCSTDSHSSAESAVSTSHSANGCDPSPTVRLTDTQPPYCSVEWLMDLYQSLQSGPMSLDLRQRFFHLSTLFTVDSPARISALQALEQGWTASEADYFSRLYDSAPSAGQLSFSSKMFQASSPTARKSFPPLRTLATTAETAHLRRVTSGRAISAIDGGFLPTPTKMDGESVTARNKSLGPNAKERPILATMAHRGILPTPKARDHRSGGGVRRGAERVQTYQQRSI